MLFAHHGNRGRQFGFRVRVLTLDRDPALVSLPPQGIKEGGEVTGFDGNGDAVLPCNGTDHAAEGDKLPMRPLAIKAFGYASRTSRTKDDDANTHTVGHNSWTQMATVYHND